MTIQNPKSKIQNPEPEALARASIRRHAVTMVTGGLGAFTIGALAAAGLAPLITGGLTAATIGSLLSELGGNALAGWVAGWAERATQRAQGDDPDAEQTLIAQLAGDLQAHLATDAALAADVGALLQRLDAIPVALGALQGQGERQARLLQLLAEDLQSAMFRNERLHDVTLQAVLVQGAALRDAYAQGNAQLAAQLDAVLKEVQTLRTGDTMLGDKVGGDKIGGNKITIGGDAEVVQPVTVSDNATVGQIIGKQVNYNFTSQPAIDPAEAQALLDRLPLDVIPDPAPLPSGSRMPFNRNPLFVGRADDLKALAAILKGGGTAAIGQVAAATGLGGIGKTNLATEFAHRYGQFFAGGVFWLSFAETSGVPAEIAACGGPGALNLPAFDALAFPDQVRRVQQEWQQTIPRLLIFDNCEDETFLDEWRPTSGGCRVLVTSRRARWSAALGVTALPLGVLARAESIALLRKHRPDLRDADADALAAELGDLPLALHLAGSTLETYRDDPTFGDSVAFLSELRSANLLDHDALQGIDATPSPTNHELHVAKTFALSYDRLDHANPVDALAVQLLARAACLAPGEPIPRELLLATLRLDEDDRVAAKQAARGVHRLVDVGLLEQTDTGALRLHRLLAAFVQQSVEDADAQEAVEDAVNDTVYQINDAGYPAAMQSILAHLRYVADVAQKSEDDRAARLCGNLSYYLHLIGNYANALPLSERMLAIRLRVLGEEHPDTAQSLNNLGMLLQDIGDLMGAHVCLEQALSIRLRVLGEEHPDTAQSLSNLGVLLEGMGDLKMARVCLEQSLAICQKVLGEIHLDTARSLSNLGMLMVHLGDLVGARYYIERTLLITQEILGEKHPTIAICLNNLGGLLTDLGNLDEAQVYLEQALAIRQQTLGEKHPYTCISLRNLGMLLKSRGDLKGARSYLEQSLAMTRKLLGENHSEVALSFRVLGGLLQIQGNLIEARNYLEQALAIYRQALGDDHPDVARSLNDLGSILQAMGELDDARKCYEQALAILEARLGPDHPNTRTVRNNLTVLDTPSEIGE